jgi:hypothetical protein
MPKERNWDIEAYEKCCSIWAAQLIEPNQSNPFFKTLQALEQGSFYTLFQAIRQSGYEKFEKKETEIAGKPVTDSAKAAFDRGMAKTTEPPMHAEDAIEQGVIEAQHEGINVEDVPF